MKLRGAAHHVFLGAVVVRLLAFVAMAVATFLWFTVPDRILYRESMPSPSPGYSVEIREHGSVRYLTPAQKATLDRLDSAMPVIWFGGAALSLASVFVAAAARLRMTERDAIRVTMGKL